MDRTLAAVLGAVVTLGFSFTVVSPVLGGGLAAWLAESPRSDGARIGAQSGALASLVFLPLLLLGAALMPFDGGMTLFILLAVVVMLSTYTVGGSLIGGYVTAALREEGRLPDIGDRSSAEPATETDTSQQQLQDLKEQYAAGELTEQEFERRLERIIDETDHSWDRHSDEISTGTRRERERK